MMEDTQAMKVLAFCRQHDWGRNAQAYQKAGAGWFIRNLWDKGRTSDGTVIDIAVTLPADMRVIREWAGY